MKIKWDEVGKRLYETGVDHGVLFPMGEDNAYGKGVPWYGLSAVNESPSGGEPNAVWADNIKYLNLMSAEDVLEGVAIMKHEGVDVSITGKRDFHNQ